MGKDFKLQLGMEFTSTKEFKEVIQEYALLNGRALKFKKNDAKRVRVTCQGSCEFVALCSRVGKTNTFRLKTLVDKHMCNKVFNNKNARSSWVAEKVVDKVRGSSKTKLSEIIVEIQSKYSASISIHTAFNALKKTKNIMEGTAKEQYANLRRYLAEMLRASNHNTCKLQIERPQGSLQPIFQRLYMCFEGSKKGFLQGCRPFIGVDGCHLKTKYGGVLLVAVGRDANDQYFPLAFAVVESETKDSWKFLLELLLDDIGDVRTHRWVFMSDQQKGLLPVFDELLHGVEHRFCLRHLYNNFKKKFGAGLMMKTLMHGAANATFAGAHREKMEQIKAIYKEAYDWLEAIPKQAWCRSAFSFYPKCYVLMNNISEAFNSTILEARDKPIITMFEWIRSYLMCRAASHREKFTRYEGVVMPKIRRRLDKEIESSDNWFPKLSGEMILEVTHINLVEKFIVDLNKHTCTCNFWDLVGIPCRHAVASIFHKGFNLVDYVADCYKREAYHRYYNHMISPINGQNMWPKVEQEPLLPPIFKRRAGRPLKLRRREPDEPTDKVTKLKRVYTSTMCSKCHQYGHNARGCRIDRAPNPSVELPTNVYNMFFL
ncbi:hypothetical protein Cni_G09387 [Canna indica]|uniref:SWIM-type domain-containing protein n=1 Tax=Canna indica TaxID=4628 RepID=A0AAQ3Q7P3_9LILI|nr:hypothetical protein Cni_G09387 [Canna indica]